MRTSKQHYKFLDDLEKKHLKKINLLIEQSRTKYKNKIIENVKKNQFVSGNFIINANTYKSIAEELFKSIDELNLIMYKQIAEYYYKQAVKDVEDVVDEEVKDKYDEKNLGDILEKFIVAKGVNYVYNQEIERRMEYYNSQMINANMAAINAKIQVLEQKYINEHYKDMIVDTLNGTSNEISTTLREQKKQVGNFIDNVAVYVASETALQVFKENGIEKVLWVAEEDDRTCTICLDYNGTVYNIDEVPTIPVHLSCRCHIEPLKE